MNEVSTITVHGTQLACIGNAELLQRPLQGVLCSTKCPAEKILEAHEHFKEWSEDSRMTIVSGFHSPVEKECLRLLLSGRAGLVYVAARELEHIRVYREWENAMIDGRMVLLSPFKERRADTVSTALRNQWVVDLADSLYLPYVNPAGRLAEVICNKPVQPT